MKARKVKRLDPKAPLAENAARLVRVRLDELRSFAPEALEPGRSKAQHDMRIAAKRLRYVLEVTELCFGDAGGSARRCAKELQGLLGDLHDCDVMLPRVELEIGELRALDADAVRRRAGAAADLEPRLAVGTPYGPALRGLETLAVYLRARRALLHERFGDFWREREADGTWAALDDSAKAARG